MLFSVMSKTISSENLDQIKSAYFNAVVNGLSVGTLLSIAVEKLAQEHKDMSLEQLRDAIISQNSLQVWDQLVESIEETDEG